MSVSVVIGVFNGEGLITRCVESVMAQTLQPSEIIIVNDGSSDGSLAELRLLESRFPDMLDIRSQKNKGVAAVLNSAVARCSGEYVANADQDDFFTADRLEKSVALLQETNADMMGGQLVGGLGERLLLLKSRFATDPESIADAIAHGFDPLPHATMMVRRDGFERFGGYRLNRRAEDLEIMLRWAHRGAKIVVSPDVLAYYTLRREHVSLNVQTRWMLYTQYARDVACLPDDEVPDFGRWFSTQPMGPARREARRRVFRMSARLALGTLTRSSMPSD
ncbi:MAG: glycosyltransferase family 2 protein [Ilumatobacteraceae bacterium]|nr:glycosyltransferase family 2 protein [Ilumatobacteraceae bacterium]